VKPRGKGKNVNIGIVIPGSVNYFYNITGERTREALVANGHAVDMFTLQDYHAGRTQRHYDLCIVVNTFEIAFGFGGHIIDHAGAKLREMLDNMGLAVAVGLEAARTPWFDRLKVMGVEVGIQVLLDYGFADQSHLLPEDYPMTYQFVVNGLTPSEKDDARRQLANDTPRNIPWAFVGHATQERHALIYQLSQHVAADGFVYIPHLEPVTKQGPHIDRDQLKTVLDRSQSFVWCSHHKDFYMESVRFRQALESGTIPIKVVLGDKPIPADIPFDYLVIREADVPTALKDFPFAATRERFIHDFIALPGLEDSLADALDQLGLS
jgi:hypothetical protein